MEVTREQIYLAALLHDIGKFYQRADSKKDKEYFEFLKKEYWDKPEVYCPQNKYGGYSHKHVLWTAQFIQENENIFNRLNIKGKGENSLTLLAASHHNPKTIFEKIIQLADWYSSGVDRSSEEYSIDDGFEGDWDLFKKRRMVSVFEKIHQEEDKQERREYSYLLPVKEINSSEEFFPEHTSKVENIIPDYATLWGKFIKDFDKIPTSNIDVFAETLLNLLHKYTVTIPSSTNHLPDVSLYDHAKTTAAFAIAIYDFYIENKRLPQKDEVIVNLIGGDLSGIQNFIYDIVSKNAAKNLKGRSFYLQLLVDSIIRYIIKELNLYSANIVYSSGGGFYILAPNTNFIKDKIEKVKKYIAEKLFEKHRTSLYIAIDFIGITEKTLLINKSENEGIGVVWRDLIEKLNKLKRQRYAEKLVIDYKNFFKPIEEGGIKERDSITGEEFEKGEKEYKLKDGSLVKKETWEQVELGKKLKKAKYWIITAEEGYQIPDEHGFNVLDLGFVHYFLPDLPKSMPDNSVVKILNEANFEIIHSNAKYSVAFTFYGGNDYPTDTEGSPKTFDKLVGEGDFKRLGILRMDVDNLGQIFINGFSENKRTFSRYSTLSRSLDFFFSGYINTIQQSNKDYKENTYILYSGGDDLFILGRWDLLIKMAKEIRHEFAKWTCYNPKISLSGGIAMVTPKFPIMKAADIAGNEEKNAKEYKNGKLEKNAFSIWEYALSWQQGYEFDIVMQLKETILEYLEKNKLPKSFVSSVYAFHELRKLQIAKHQNESWQWQMAYMLKRFKEGKPDEIKDFIEQIQKDVFADAINGKKNYTKYHYLELLNIACRLAELELRTNK